MTTEEKEVYAAYEAINDAMIAKDQAAMERYFDEKLTFTLTAKVYGISGAWTLTGENTYRKRGGIWVRVK